MIRLPLAHGYLQYIAICSHLRIQYFSVRKQLRLSTSLHTCCIIYSHFQKEICTWHCDVAQLSESLYLKTPFIQPPLDLKHHRQFRHRDFFS